MRPTAPEFVPGRSPFDRLPDDVLRRILEFAIARNTMFFIDETSCGPGLHDMVGRKGNTPQKRDFDDPVTTVRSIYPVRSEKFIGRHDGSVTTRKRVERGENIVYLSQKVHVADWVLINSINHRVRNLGRAAFFRGKSFGMSIKLLPRIAAGKVPFLHGSEVRRLALENITDLTLTYLRDHKASNWLKLPQLVRIFGGLKTCTITIVRGFEIEGMDHLVYRCRMPDSLAELLVNIGMSKDMELHLCGMLRGTRLPQAIMRLESKVYLHLQTRAKMLREARERGYLKGPDKADSSGQFANGGASLECVKLHEDEFGDLDCLCRALGKVEGQAEYLRRLIFTQFGDGNHIHSKINSQQFRPGGSDGMEMQTDLH